MKIIKNYKQSIFNLFFEYEKTYYAYNSFSNALAILGKKEYLILSKFRNKQIPKSLENIVDDLIKGNYIVEKGLDELVKCKIIFDSKKWARFLSFTIAPTLLCNCNCNYCFQQKTTNKMEKRTYNKITDLIIANIQQKNIKDIRITWYGGEPLLEKQDILMFYKSLSKKVKKEYLSTTFITNGTLIDTEFINKVNKYTNIKRIQITIDGEKSVHDKKRFLNGGLGTYELIMKNIAPIIDIVKISLRINIDKSSLIGIEKLFKDFKIRQLHQRKNVTIYFGHLRNYTNNVIMDTNEFLSASEFTSTVIKLTKKLKNLGFKNTLYPNSFPTCMIDHYNSFVIDPMGDIYKCWDLIGNKNVVMGNIDNIEKALNSQIYYNFMNFDPQKFTTCKNCLFFPNCLGKCAIVKLGYSEIDNKHDVCKNVRESLIEQLKIKIYDDVNKNEKKE